MQTTINVLNIKCGGCANSIRKSLKGVAGVTGTPNVDVETGVITVEHDDSVTREVIAEKLRAMGYPEDGTVNGFDAMKAGAKSFVSCAIGRMSK